MVVTSLQNYLSWSTVRISLPSWEAHAAAQEDVKMQMLDLGIKGSTNRNRFMYESSKAME